MGCTAGLKLGQKVKPYTSKTTCEAATATDAAPGKGKACVYTQVANKEGSWNEDKGTKKISSGGALIIVAILFMAAAIVLAGYQLRKDQDEEDKAAAAPAVEPNLVAIRQE